MSAVKIDVAAVPDGLQGCPDWHQEVPAPIPDSRRCQTLRMDSFWNWREVQESPQEDNEDPLGIWTARFLQVEV